MAEETFSAARRMAADLGRMLGAVRSAPATEAIDKVAARTGLDRQYIVNAVMRFIEKKADGPVLEGFKGAPEAPAAPAVGGSLLDSLRQSYTHQAGPQKGGLRLGKIMSHGALAMALPQLVDSLGTGFRRLMGGTAQPGSANYNLNDMSDIDRYLTQARMRNAERDRQDSMFRSAYHNPTGGRPMSMGGGQGGGY